MLNEGQVTNILIFLIGVIYDKMENHKQIGELFITCVVFFDNPKYQINSVNTDNQIQSTLYFPDRVWTMISSSHYSRASTVMFKLREWSSP